MKMGKIVGGIVGVGIVAVGVSALLNNGAFNDGGVDVNNTACEGIGAARQAVNEELDSRKAGAQATLETAMETASDAFWAENRQLEDTHHECITEALVADPCKALFEQASSIAQDILNNIDNGFDEAKFQERERVKAEYDKCVEKAQKDEFFDEAKAQCDSALTAGQQANQEAREASEATAQATHDSAVEEAESAHQRKHGILNAIEEKCNEPAGNTNINAGGITTGSTGTPIATGSACSGSFEGNDEELRTELRRLESQLQKARAAGLREGLYGSDHLQEGVDNARQALRESGRSCEQDSDCGDTTPVCCSNIEIGRVYCDAGTCANEKIACDDPEVCAGSPAQCVDPSIGAESQPIEISRTIPEVGSCSLNLQNLNLQKGTPDSHRFEIIGFPNWVHATPPGGSLPASSSLTYDCNTVQGFGEGTYTANGSVTVYDSGNNLINTIPINISITVEPAQEDPQDQIAVIGYNGQYIPVDQLRRVTGPECDKEEHWHPAGSSVTTTAGNQLSDPNPNGCGFGKTAEVPVMTIPATGHMEIRVEGLEGLRTR